MANYLSDRTGANIDIQLDKADTLLTSADGEILYHTGNTGVTSYSNTNPDGTTDEIVFGLGSAIIRTARVGTSSLAHFRFINSNGQVGSIDTSGTATVFNTSSDPRLKDFEDAPSDSAINEEFNTVFSCFKTFKWKNDPDGELVWGFDAHACIDKNTNIGTEGAGPRDLALGTVYKTTDATYKSIASVDDNGDFTGETEEIELTPKVEHKVLPAGVDQSKAVPILLAKIEQLERRLVAAGF